MKKFIILIISLIFLCTGCTYNEINNLAIANSVGIDYEDDMYTITLQIMDLNTDNNKSSNIDENTLMYVGKGDSIPTAIRNISLKYPNTVYLGHLELMVIGKGMVEYDIEKTFDYFIRSPEARSEAYLLISTEYNAIDILDTNDENKEAFPTRDIITTIENSTKRNGRINEISMEEFVATNLKKGIDPIVPVIKESKNPNKNFKNTKIIGMSVFKDNKLIDILDDKAIIAYNIINNNYQDIIINTEYKDDKASIVLINPKNSFKVKVSDDGLNIYININTDAYLVDGNNIKITNDKTLKVLENSLNSELKKYVDSLIEFSKENNTDILGVKNKIYKFYKKKYDLYKDSNVYEKANIIINTNTKLFRYGNSNTGNYGGHNE